MHADAYPQPADPRADGMGRAVTYAIGLHVLFALVLWLSTQFSWERKTASAAGLPVIEASLDASASEMRAAESALSDAREARELVARECRHIAHQMQEGHLRRGLHLQVHDARAQTIESQIGGNALREQFADFLERV